MPGVWAQLDEEDAWIGCDNKDTCGRWFHYCQFGALALTAKRT